MAFDARRCKERLVEEFFDLEVLFTDAMTFIPVDFNVARLSRLEPYFRRALHFAPPTGTILLTQNLSRSYAPAFSNYANVFNFADDLEVHPLAQTLTIFPIACILPTQLGGGYSGDLSDRGYSAVRSRLFASCALLLARRERSQRLGSAAVAPRRFAMTTTSRRRNRGKSIGRQSTRP